MTIAKKALDNLDRLLDTLGVEPLSAEREAQLQAAARDRKEARERRKRE